ncbi:MAG: hypothetical protein NVS9B4_00160 [Candidatus Acidiferrum sp.]
MVSDLTRKTNPPPWKIENDRCVGLILDFGDIGVVVLPWCQFMHAGGSDIRIVAYWTTHTVTITGGGLLRLIEQFATQEVSRITQSKRTEIFEKSGPWIDQIQVDERDED